MKVAQQWLAEYDRVGYRIISDERAKEIELMVNAIFTPDEFVAHLSRLNAAFFVTAI
jgi:hypothetical protein